MPAYGTVQLNVPEVAVDKLKPGVGGQSGFGELDSQFPIDTAAQIGFSSSHSVWPFVEVGSCCIHLLQTTTGGPFQYRIPQGPQLFLSN